MGHAGVPELAQSMKLEWSDEALADLDRFAEFLDREHRSLAAIVATEIIDKVRVLSEHPQLGRPIAGREEVLGGASSAMQRWQKIIEHRVVA
jgi:plasmid stabilization system protein ParE